jgi:nitroimidazol reductase NimA-like FMN-containing flavoprotein (pyridoxamine 5'-phosphate oxidase superfamily)
MSDIDWNKLIKEALDRTEFMAISTVGKDGSWTCPVQFGYSNKLDLYFKSMPHSRHMQYLQKDNRISVAIFKTERFEESREVLGLQLRGKAKILTDRAEAEEAARHYYGRDPRKIDYRTKIDEHLGESTWKFVSITPEEAWCFDSRVFGEERREIDLRPIQIYLDY